MIVACGAWSLYDFVVLYINTYNLLSPLMNPQVISPNGVFSGRIISSVVMKGDTLHTAEYQLSLGPIALPGIFHGACLCDGIDRKDTMILDFSGNRFSNVVMAPTAYQSFLA